MGCDIHVIVEAKRYNHWNDVLYLPSTPRDYWLFGHMAYGVRTEPETGAFEIRGLPQDVGFRTLRYFFCEILPQEEVDEWENDGYYGGYPVTEETAKEWERYGCERRTLLEKYHFVKNIDLHSLSWLTTSEFSEALRNTAVSRKKIREDDYKEAMSAMNDAASSPDKLFDAYLQFLSVGGFSNVIEPEYVGILSYMQALEAQGVECRLVFGFDN